MDYSMPASNVADGVEVIVFDVHGLYAHLLAVKDWRGRRGQRYQLALSLTVLVLAKLAGEDTPSGIARWARQRQGLFCEVFHW